MKISKKMQDLINIQIKNEFDNAFLYLSISNWFEEQNLKGFANWNFIQFQEEQEHAMKFRQYLLDRQGEVEVKEITKPKKSWNSAKDVFAEILAKEEETTQCIYKLYDAALAENDYTSLSLLKWFLDEQVEEEDNASTILGKLELIGDSKIGLLALDKEVGKRQAE